MKKYIVSFFAIFVFISLPAYAEMTTSQIAQKYSPSVVTIIALDENDQPLSLGSGFFVNQNGEIVTNYHVLQDSAKATIRTARGEKGDILEIIKADPELDLVVAKTSLKNTVPVRLGDSDRAKAGDDIVAIGNPAGLERTVSKGIISGIRKTEGVNFIQITAPISPGSSGGPVFNQSGETIGVATASFTTGQNLNFAMPINYIKSISGNRTKLTSLKKTAVKKSVEDISLVKTVDVHYLPCYKSTTLCGVDFVLQNNNTYAIRNISLFFVYKKSVGSSKNLEAVSYSAMRIKDTILPKLALQFKHDHNVYHFCEYVGGNFSHCDYGHIAIRILDYEIVRTPGTSPEDLLFK
jgi:hypothetical protein